MAFSRVLPGLAPGALRVDGRQAGPFVEHESRAGSFPHPGSGIGAGTASAGAPGGPHASPMQAGQRARWTLGAMVGRSSEMERLFLQMRYVASHLRVALIEGERGTGKALAARTLHDLSNVRGRNFVACLATDFFRAANIQEQLAAARGGTLYLSGVDSLNAEGQGRLLHLLGWLGGAGGRFGNHVHGRSTPQAQGSPAAAGLSSSLEEDAEGVPGIPRALIVSSARSLRSLVLHGSFRGELHPQLSAVQFRMPALRDRREDIPMLAEAILAHAPNAHGRPLCGILQEALSALLGQPWAGNVTELRELLRQGAARSTGEWLRRADLLLPGEVSLRSRTSQPGASGSSRDGEPPPYRGGRATAGPVSKPISGSPSSPSFGATRSHDPRGGSTWVAPRGAGPRLAAIDPAPVTRLGAEAFRGREGEHGPAYGFAPRQPSRSKGEEGELDPNLDRAILRHIRRVLEGVGGNKLRAARLLGISRSTLYRLLDTDTAGGNRSNEDRLSAGLRSRPAISAFGRQGASHEQAG